MANDELARAIELKREGRLDEAVVALQGLLARQPGNSTALVHLAQCHLRRRKLPAAIEALDQAEAEGGTTAYTAQLRGDVLYRQRRYAQAARAYGDAGALGHRGAWPLAQLARCRLRAGDLEGARQAAVQAVERDPGSSDGWVIRGEVELAVGELAEAEAMLARAHEQDPRSTYAYAKLIETRLLGLEPEDRAREVQVLLRTTGSGSRHLLQVLARVQSQLGDPEAAAGAWRRSREGSDNTFALKMEAYALKKAGKLEAAAAAFRDYLLQDPADVVAFRNYVGLERQRGALEQLEQTLQELLPIAGGRTGAVYSELRKLGELRRLGAAGGPDAG